MSNRYAGNCEDCGTRVSARAGVLERAGRNWVVRCQPCFDKSDGGDTQHMTAVLMPMRCEDWKEIPKPEAVAELKEIAVAKTGAS